jgi:FlaA1/EpsC-like NDP-sugar epimerase
MSAHFAGKSVLVTGAGGSIGSQVCSQIVADGAKRLVMVSLTEAGLYNIDRGLRRDYGKYRDTKLVPVLGNAGDPQLIASALKDVDIVIHAAAHKHVPICEANPIAAIANNVQMTWRLMTAAEEAGVKQFCLISSDKAVNPTCVMGATKRLAELMMADRAGKGVTRFFTVRFGNVLDSAGSVLPLWREQIEKGGPITLTDSRCERYFMEIHDAVALISNVLALEPLSGTFVLDMGKPRKLIDMAYELIHKASRQVEIDIVGLRPGEKLTEELHYGGELRQTDAKRVFKVEEAHKSLDPMQIQRLFDATRLHEVERARKALWSLVA